MTKQNPNIKTHRLAVTAVSVLSLCGTVQAQLYWDTNNATTGFGTAGGTWAAPTTNSASQGWSSSSTGSTALSGTTTTNTTSALNFGTSTNRLGTGTITVSGSVEANSLTFVSSGGSNNTTLSGGNITLGGTTPSITVTNIANTAATTQTIASNIILGANQTWTVNSGGTTGTATLTASGRISGGFGITKSGNGTLSLNGNNTYTGGTAINAGRLDIRNANALGTGNVTIASGAFAGVQNAVTISNNFIIAGNGTGNGAIQATPTDSATLSGLVTLSDNAMIGARSTAGGLNFTLTGGITSNGTDRTLTLNTFGSTTIANNQLTISTNSVNLGTGGILDIGHGMNAGGTATFNINVGSNTWGTTIVRGLATAAASTNATLNLGAVNALGSSSSVLQLGSLNTALEGITVNLNGNSQTIGGLRSFGSTGSASANGTRTVTSATAATLTIDNSSGTNYLFDGAITGNLSLTKSGSATQTLSGNNTYNGGTTVNAGALNVTSTGSLASGSAFTLGASATADLANVGQTLGAVSNSNSASNALNFSSSTGTVTLASLSGTGNTRFGSNAIITGGIGEGTVNAIGSLTANITGGTTTVGGVATIGTMSAGTANLNGTTSSIITLSGGNIALGSSTVLSVSGGSSSGIISGGGSLNKTGAGSLELLGANTYTGNTTVSEGTLAVNGSLAGGVTVINGATLQGNGTISGATTIGGSLKPGNSPGLLTFANSVTLQSTASTTMEIVGNSTLSRGVTYDAIAITGALVYDGTLTLHFSGPAYGQGVYTFDLFDFASQSGSFTSMSLAGLYSGALINNAGVWGYQQGDNTWSFNQGDGVLTFTVVPEPNVAMMVGSLALMTLLRRRRD